MKHLESQNDGEPIWLKMIRFDKRLCNFYYF